MNEEYLKDHRIIEEEFAPVFQRLDEKGVDPFSFCIFFATYLNRLMKEMNNDKKKEAIIRIFMD